MQGHMESSSKLAKKTLKCSKFAGQKWQQHLSLSLFTCLGLRPSALAAGNSNLQRKMCRIFHLNFRGWPGLGKLGNPKGVGGKTPKGKRSCAPNCRLSAAENKEYGCNTGREKYAAIMRRAGHISSVFFTINFQAFNPVSVRLGSVNYINLTKGPASELSAHTWSAANSLKHQYKSALRKIECIQNIPSSIKYISNLKTNSIA